MKRARAALLSACLAACLVSPAQASARDLTDDGRVSLRSSLTTTLVASRAPDDPLLFPERDSDVTLWRLRLAPEAKPFEWMSVQAAFEERIRQPSSAQAVAAFGALPGEPPPPYRLKPLEGLVARTTSGSTWYQEVDRASIALHLPSTELVVGRQAIGWGRGFLFSAVDVWAPLGPLEIDRDWRRGVDAVHLEGRFGRRLSADAAGAYGSDVDHSAMAARVRGYFGEADAELVGGWRARDVFGGATVSAVAGDAEVHAEAALFRAPDPLPAGGAFGDDRLAPKGLVGASYRFDVGRGLTAIGEYHYSGFGAPSAARLPALLLVPAFQERLARGDSQILGRQALAATLGYSATDTLQVSAIGLVSPVDGSGIAGPALDWAASDQISLRAGLYLPFGAAPRGLDLRSEYGFTPASLFVQLRLFD